MKPQTILVTGCSSGIGYHCAIQLHKMGHRVLASARKHQDVERLIEAGLKDSFQLDIADEKSVQSAFEFIQQSAAPIDILFNNAAYGQPGATEDLTRAMILNQFNTNVFGTMDVTNRMISLMRNQGYGKIVHNSSVLGIVSLQYRGAYNASKYALEGFADTQRQELHGSNISISLIEPGPILSKFRDNAYRHFKQIDIENSPHRERYQKMIKHFTTQGAAVPFTLGPEAVLDKLLAIMNSSKPNAHYYVTFPTYLFAYLKRILPTAMLDRILMKV